MSRFTHDGKRCNKRSSLLGILSRFSSAEEEEEEEEASGAELVVVVARFGAEVDATVEAPPSVVDEAAAVAPPCLLASDSGSRSFSLLKSTSGSLARRSGRSS